MEKERKILEQPYRSPRITEKTIEEILKNPRLYRGHVRTAMGSVYKTDDFKRMSDDVLGKRMP